MKNSRHVRIRRIVALPGCLLAFLLGLWVPSNLLMTTSNSLDHNVFWILGPAGERELKSGDYVAFDFVNPWEEDNGPVLFAKRIGCAPGEKLRMGREGFYCNGKYLGRIHIQNFTRKAVRPFEFDGVVPEGNYFVVGSHKESYDSRYFGLIHKTEIKLKLWPIF